MLNPNVSLPVKELGKPAGLLKKYILECLLTSGSDTIKTDLNTFTARKGSQSLVIDDEELLPDEFVESFTEVVNRVKKDELKRQLWPALKFKVRILKLGHELYKCDEESNLLPSTDSPG